MSKVKWSTGAAVLALTGAVVAGCAKPSGEAAGTASTPGVAAAAVQSETPAAVQSETPAAVQSKSTAAGAASPRAGASVLSGKRQVAIVRVQAFESALSIVNGRLTEVDDDSGRSLFVPTPLGQNSYLIKAYAKPTDKPVCWQATQTQTTAPLTVKGAPCDAKNPSQRFTITAEAKGTYAISSASAFLQYFPTSGLILEELGDAPLVSTFRLVDNGPAPTTGG